MELYFHVDRTAGLRALKSGIIAAEPYDFGKESYLNLLRPILDTRFVIALEKIFEEGLSTHGAQYFVQAVQTGTALPSLLSEICAEYMRQLEFPGQPSRLQSMFAWADLNTANTFKKKHGGRGEIFTIEPLGWTTRLDRHDVNCLDISLGSAETDRLIRSYWLGEPRQRETAQWEYLMKCPVKVTGKVGSNGEKIEVPKFW